MRYYFMMMLLVPALGGSNVAPPVLARTVEIRRVSEVEVVATMYQPVRSQTDRTPNILADGTRIDVRKAGSYRYVAMSRDLLKRWGGDYDYDDVIVVEGAGSYDGEWKVKDTMHHRWEKRIDFLCDITTKPFKYLRVKVKKKEGVRIG